MIEKQGSNGIKQIGAATRKQSRSKTNLENGTTREFNPNCVY